MSVDTAQCVGRAALAQLGDVGPSREHAAGAGEDQGARCGFELGAQRVQRIDGGLVDRVALVRTMERRDHTVAVALDEEGIAGGRGFRHHTFSTIRAAPCPTPTHMVARP